MSLQTLVDEFRLHVAELKQFGSTDEARKIQVLAEKLYYLALEVKRLDDVMQVAVKRK